MNLIQKLTQLQDLQTKRRELERECANPDVWEDLAGEYTAIGAESNAAACTRRANAYRISEAQGETPMRNPG